MTRTQSTIAIAAALCAPAIAQTTGIVTAQAFPDVIYRQEFSQTATVELGSNTVRTQMMIASPIIGKPFTASQDQHSLQVLADGTRIEHTETSQIARDSLGRTRTEAAHAPGERSTFATIQDPTDGSNAILNLAAKTVDQIAARAGRRLATFESRSIDGAMIPKPMALITGAAEPAQIVVNQARTNISKPQIEDLGTQNINGVLAKGTRNTISIPAGEIGNDRPIQIVNERWYSDELQMVVKSSNADPRFGTTEFNLTGISRSEPDASLFQIPADYKPNSPK